MLLDADGLERLAEVVDYLVFWHIVPDRESG